MKREVYEGDEFLGEIHEDIFGKGCQLPTEALKEFLVEKARTGGKRFLLKKLARKGLLKAKAMELLLERCVSEEIAREIILELDHFFDDEYLTESKIRSKMKKNLGKERVKRDLWGEKIAEDVFDEVYEKVEGEEGDSVERAVQFIQKTVKDQKKLEDYAEKQKLIAKLFRRGFELDDIHEALARIHVDTLRE